MARKITRTWWGERFLDALQQRIDPGRLSRGRAYAGPKRMLDFCIEGKEIKAKIRGNINAYFGVHKEPKYKISIKLKTISKEKWKAIIKEIAGNAAWLSRLMMNEMPDNIQQAFAKHDVDLLPGNHAGDLITDCSCPDWSNPCKHIAGTYYKVASMLDRDPFLIFELRGMDKATLHQVLADSPLGKALLAQITQPDTIPMEYAQHRYTQPCYQNYQDITLKQFWHMPAPPLPETSASSPLVSAALIRKQGDYPPFWDLDHSFVEVMEEVYERISVKNKAIL